MDSGLVAFVVFYAGAGLLTYALGDNRDVTERVESRLLFVPYALVLESALFVTAALWPVWLVSRWRRRRR